VLQEAQRLAERAVDLQRLARAHGSGVSLRKRPACWSMAERCVRIRLIAAWVACYLGYACARCGRIDEGVARR
jgi:hypothetical protein